MLVALPGLLAGCGKAAESPLPNGPAEVAVQMREYAFELKGPINRRAVSFRVVNEGALLHDLTLIQVPERLKETLDAQLKGPNRLYVVPIAQLKPRRPGQEGIFAADLKPGRYGLICFVTDPDGVQHARKGMSREFRIG